MIRLGADLCIFILEIDLGKDPDWDAGYEMLDSLTDTTPVSMTRLGRVHNPENDADYDVDEVRHALDMIRDVWYGDAYRRDLHHVRLKYTEALVTGGMSWGDAPTDAFDDISLLIDFGIARAMGFE